MEIRNLKSFLQVAERKSFTKAILASTFGWGVVFAAVSVFVLQGSIVLCIFIKRFYNNNTICLADK